MSGARGRKTATTVDRNTATSKAKATTSKKCIDYLNDKVRQTIEEFLVESVLPETLVICNSYLDDGNSLPTVQQLIDQLQLTDIKVQPKTRAAGGAKANGLTPEEIELIESRCENTFDDKYKRYGCQHCFPFSKKDAKAGTFCGEECVKKKGFEILCERHSTQAASKAVYDFFSANDEATDCDVGYYWRLVNNKKHLLNNLSKIDRNTPDCIREHIKLPGITMRPFTGKVASYELPEGCTLMQVDDGDLKGCVIEIDSDGMPVRCVGRGKTNSRNFTVPAEKPEKLKIWTKKFEEISRENDALLKQYDIILKKIDREGEKKYKAKKAAMETSENSIVDSNDESSFDEPKTAAKPKRGLPAKKAAKKEDSVSEEEEEVKAAPRRKPVTAAAKKTAAAAAPREEDKPKQPRRNIQPKKVSQPVDSDSFASSSEEAVTVKATQGSGEGSQKKPLQPKKAAQPIDSGSSSAEDEPKYQRPTRPVITQKKPKDDDDFASTSSGEGNGKAEKEL